MEGSVAERRDVSEWHTYGEHVHGKQLERMEWQIVAFCLLKHCCFKLHGTKADETTRVLMNRCVNLILESCSSDNFAL